MKDKIIINPHSFIDVITNSSTELFVIDDNRVIEWIKNLLEEAIRLHNFANGTKYIFEDIFQEIYYGKTEDALGYWNEFFDPIIKEGIIIKGANDHSIPYWMFDFIESTFDYKSERFHLG